MTTEREQCVYLAKLAEKAERPDEMVEYMRRVAEMKVELSEEERQLLWLAYKTATGTRRNAWRTLYGLAQMEAAHKEDGGSSTEQSAAWGSSYRTKVEGELDKICTEALGLCKECLIPSASSGEAKVFYLKMQGDYHRYITEYAQEAARDEAAQAARGVYAEGLELAQAELPVWHPIRLGLVLNFAVFHVEVLYSVGEALAMAKEAFKAAYQEIEQKVQDPEYQESVMLMQLLQDNMSLWASEAGEAATGSGEEPVEVQDMEA